jgi:hypothetical protein
MTKKHLVLALSLVAALCFATGAFAQTCTTANIEFVGAGSSAQFNTLAYAAQDILGGTSNFNLISAKSNASVVDSGPSYEVPAQPTLSDGATFWVAYDNAVNCDVYMYFSIDSGIGVKDFMRAVKFVAPNNGKTFQVAGAYAQFTNGIQTTACNGTAANCNQVGGLADQISSGCTGSLACTLDIMPAAVFNAINNNIPANLVNVATGVPQPQPFCGVLNGTAGFYCTFNAAGTDIRPEDALYAVTRALSAYNTTNGLAGLGYGNTACGANSSFPTQIGCPIYDAFGQKKVFNVLNFALTGSDPISKGTPPPYTTISVGAAPVVVFVSNTKHDGTTNEFGRTHTDVYGNTSYVYYDVLDKVLSLYFEGTLYCSGDMLIDGSTNGVPVQVVQREPLSGTYNTFEFTGVRTLYGSAATAAGLSKISSTTWITDDQSGQESLIDPSLNTPGCSNGAPGNGSVPNIPCGDGLAVYGGPNPSVAPTHAQCLSGSTLTAGAPLRLRAIGTGEEVPAALGSFNGCTNGTAGKCPTNQNSISSTPFNVENGLGYAFWSYGNFSPVKPSSGCTTTNPVTCSSYLGHYLTVSGVDPFFYTEGGEAEPSGTGNNPSGPFNLPLCNLNPGSTSGTLAGGPCFQIPFPHIADGKYPLWSLLRIVTFANKAGKFATPAAVLNMAAFDQIEVANSIRNTSDFVPFLKNLCAPLSQWNGTTCAASTDNNWNGNLNLWVFRSHFVQSKINPFNGHSVCTTLSNTTFIDLVGGNTATPTCLVDAGGDEGGVPLTVQADQDFNLDFGGVTINGKVAPKEIYGLHQ